VGRYRRALRHIGRDMKSVHAGLGVTEANADIVEK
jgi:hypothetical protein